VAKIVEKGFIRESWHSETERAYRNISDEDVLFGLERKDWTLKKADFDDKHNSYEYLIRTVDVEGDGLRSSPSIKVNVMTEKETHNCQDHLEEREATASHPYRYVGSGLPNVFLVGIKSCAKYVESKLLKFLP
jgi:hypothetical protein